MRDNVIVFCDSNRVVEVVSDTVAKVTNLVNGKSVVVKYQNRASLEYDKRTHFKHLVEL